MAGQRHIPCSHHAIDPGDHERGHDSGVYGSRRERSAETDRADDEQGDIEKKNDDTGIQRDEFRQHDGKTAHTARRKCVRIEKDGDRYGIRGTGESDERVLVDRFSENETFFQKRISFPGKM